MPRQKSSQLKWKRADTGRYESTNGHWLVEAQNDGKYWKLFDQRTGEEELLARQKKVCQDKAQSLEDNPPKPIKMPPSMRPKSPPPKRSKHVEGEAECKATTSGYVETTSQSAEDELQNRELTMIPKLPVPLDFPGARDWASIAASFRLEVARLTDMVGMLNAVILRVEKELAEVKKTLKETRKEVVRK